MLRFGLFVSFLIVGSAAAGPRLHAAPRTTVATAPSPARPLAEMLDANGRLTLPAGFSGSLDARGWRLASAEREPPRFVPLRNAGSTTPLKTAGSSTPQVAGDDKWTSFGLTNGINGLYSNVLALVADGSGNVYVGGSFVSAGNAIASNIAKWDGTSWSALGNGLRGAVSALAWDSTNHLLYAGGSFVGTCAGADCSGLGITVNNIAKWNGTSWSGLGYGVNARVNALAVDGSGHLYAGGGFSGYCTAADCSTTTAVNYIAEWKVIYYIGAWSALGSGTNVGVDSWVEALAWDGTSDVLYVGGDFAHVAKTSVAANHIAQYSPTAKVWAPLNLGTKFGVNKEVEALAWDGTNDWLYVGGKFDHWCADAACASDGPAVNYIGRWDTADVLGWSGLNNGVDGSVFALALNGATVYAGGNLNGWCADVACTTVNATNGIASWTPFSGGSWGPLGSGVRGSVSALAESGGSVYAGGSIYAAGGVAATRIAKWSHGPPGAWSALTVGNGLSASVDVVAADGNGNLYLGGEFKYVGNLMVNYIARWNVSSGTWSALQYGLKGIPSTLVVGQDGGLYVGGSFDYLCGDADCNVLGDRVNHIAKWSPSGSSGSWSGIGYGFSGDSVETLTLDQTGKLYAGGSFASRCKNADCTTKEPANYVAQWNGSDWSAVGNGVAGEVFALAVDKNNILYVGGWFANLCASANCTSLGARVNQVAKWNPALGSWSGMGNGVSGRVAALAVDRNNNLYAGGYFGKLCGGPVCNSGTVVNNVAEWNPGSANWSLLANGVSDHVNALVVDDSNNLFAGGWFTNLCGNSDCTSLSAQVNRVAVWNGNSWSALGSGIGPAVVNALYWRSGALSVGGTFSRAGDKVSTNFAQYLYGNSLYLPLVLKP